VVGIVTAWFTFDTKTLHRNRDVKNKNNLHHFVLLTAVRLCIIVTGSILRVGIFLVKERTNTLMRERCTYYVIKLSFCPDGVIELFNQNGKL
jgi:hypothetical protein